MTSDWGLVTGDWRLETRERQTLVSSFRAIARNLSHSRSGGRCLDLRNGKTARETLILRFNQCFPSPSPSDTLVELSKPVETVQPISTHRIKQPTNKRIERTITNELGQ